MLSVVLILLNAIPVFSILSESSDEVQLVSAHPSCTSEQTECYLGCCPYADGECCDDGWACCQQGHICVAGICISLAGKNQSHLSLVSSKATRVENLITPCPSGSTTCGIGKCCPSPDATCCKDGEHCCPYGYRCDIDNKSCSKNADYNYYLPENPSIELAQTVRKEPYKSCPGGNRQCPSYMSCCLNDDGGWGCCPNPSSSMYRSKAAQSCCLTIFFHWLCCDDFCTPLGCI